MTEEEQAAEEARALLYRSNQLSRNAAARSRAAKVAGNPAQVVQILEDWQPVILAQQERQNHATTETGGGNPYR